MRKNGQPFSNYLPPTPTPKREWVEEIRPPLQNTESNAPAWARIPGDGSKNCNELADDAARVRAQNQSSP